MARLTSAASVLISDDVSFFMCRHSNLALGFAQAFSFTISSRKPDGLTRRRRQQPLAVASPLSRVAPLVGCASAFIVMHRGGGLVFDTRLRRPLLVGA